MTQGICEESQVSKVRSEAESESGDPLEERGRQEGARARACIHTARVCLACVCVCPMWVVCLFRANAWCVYTCACVLCTCVECVHACVHGWCVCTCMQMGVCTCTHLYAEVKNAFQHTVETESGWLGGQEW